MKIRFQGCPLARAKSQGPSENDDQRWSENHDQTGMSTGPNENDDQTGGGLKMVTKLEEEE